MVIVESCFGPPWPIVGCGCIGGLAVLSHTDFQTFGGAVGWSKAHKKATGHDPVIYQPTAVRHVLHWVDSSGRPVEIRVHMGDDWWWVAQMDLFNEWASGKVDFRVTQHPQRRS